MLRVFEPIKYRLNRGWLHHIAFLLLSRIFIHIFERFQYGIIAHTYTLLRWKNQFESYNPMIVNYRLIEFQRERKKII